MLVCCVLAILLVSYLVVCLAFMPHLPDQVRGISRRRRWRWLMGTLGISATIGSFAISGLSDRIGRRPVMIAMPLIGIILPLGAHVFRRLGLGCWPRSSSSAGGWSASSRCSWRRCRRKASTRPRVATALGLCMGTGEVLGGVLSPVAGRHRRRSLGAESAALDHGRPHRRGGVHRDAARRNRAAQKTDTRARLSFTW